MVVFQALDYGLSENEEQTLSPGLEALLERMTGSESGDEADGGDEGIDAGDDASGAVDRISLQTVMEVGDLPSFSNNCSQCWKRDWL